jgi:Zn finger protein HypA/HybF involved in hydrogenase expression
MSTSPGADRTLACPFCGSQELELVSSWGGQLITSAVRCRACNTHFEALRHDLECETGAGPAEGADRDRRAP